MSTSHDNDGWQKEDDRKRRKKISSSGMRNVRGGGIQSWEWPDPLRGRRRRRRLHRLGFGMGWIVVMVIMVMLSLVSPASAVFLDFDNCLDETIANSSPLQLQFVPFDVDVWFDLTDPLRPLNITVYGNVSGTADQRSDYPAPDDPQWLNASNTVGKIADLSTSNNKYSTLLKSVDVVSFTPYSDASRFCDSVIQGECPLGPVFYANS